MQHATQMRTLAIDLGEKRIGLALSDEGARFATPVEVLQVASPQSTFERIIDFIKKEDVRRIVLGLPLNMDGTLGGTAKKTIEWGRELSIQSRIPVLYVDERLSSFAAEQSLTQRKLAGERMTRKDKKQRQDALAAARFLQDFLDGQLALIDVNPLLETRA